MTTAVATPARPRGRARRRRLSALAWAGFVVAGMVIVLALVGPWLAPHDPDAIFGLPFGAPEPGFPMGFDALGRDAFSRFLAGGRYALLAALAGFAIGAAIGLTAGLLSAYARGSLDATLSWISEVLIGFPSLILMMIVVAALGSSFWVLVAALVLVGVPRIFRIVRAAALEVRGNAYVEVAEARGERSGYILFREMFPAVMPPFLVDAGIRVPAYILLVASLSFLGLGVQPPASDWGLIISENRAALTVQPLVVVGPIAALALLMIGVNVGLDGVQRMKPQAAVKEIG